MKKIIPTIVLMVSAALIAGCASVRSGGSRHVRIPPASTTVTLTRTQMTQDARLLSQFAQELRTIAGACERLQERVGVQARSSLTPELSDETESLLYRYLVSRESLVEIGALYSGVKVVSISRSETRSLGSLLGIFARLLIRYYDSTLADQFMDAPLIISKWNAAYPESNIAAGSYRRLSEAALSSTNREVQEAAWRLFSEELKNPYSALSRAVAASPECGVLVRAIQSLRPRQEQSVKSLLRRRAKRDPRFVVRTRPGRVAMLVDRARQSSETSLDAAVALDSRGIAQLIAATVSPPLSLTPAQRNQLFSLLQPGDVVLTYRKGYLSNLFFPGKFIHGLTYVGEQKGRVMAPEGISRDVIEAVGPGVMMNSLDFIVDKHISRLAVLRPRLTAAERQSVMKQLFGYMGRDYDMSFNFKSDRRLCCTEVIYHLFDGRGPIQFKLVKRLGLKTLSADDILNNALSSPASGLDVVCVLDEKRGSRGKRALLLTGRAASDHLRRLLK